MVRAVIDTNVIVSGLLSSNGGPRMIWVALKNCQFTPVISPHILNEISVVISRSKFLISISTADRMETLSVLKAKAESTFPETLITDCRDATDNHLLSVAVDANADCIVTGDKDLLVLNPFRGIAIVTPAEFIKKFL